jgi:hypothetical protein
VFNRTRDPNYLITARQMASYFVNHIPRDGTVPWCVWSAVSSYLILLNLVCRDFDAPVDPPRPADTSAATIAATALLLLANMEKSLTPSNTTGYKLWTEHAIQARYPPPTANNTLTTLAPSARSSPTQLSLPGSLTGRVCYRTGQ